MRKEDFVIYINEEDEKVSNSELKVSELLESTEVGDGIVENRQQPGGSALVDDDFGDFEDTPAMELSSAVPNESGSDREVASAVDEIRGVTPAEAQGDCAGKLAADEDDQNFSSGTISKRFIILTERSYFSNYEGRKEIDHDRQSFLPANPLEF